MMFVLGMVAGAAIALVGFVAFMAPKHWDWYHQNVDLKAALRNAVEERDHYKSMSYPSEWGPVAQHEARIVPKVQPWAMDNPIRDLIGKGDVKHRFDDIKDGGDK